MDIQFLLWLQGIREVLGPGVEQFFVGVYALVSSAAFMLIPCVVFWCFDKRAGVLSMFCMSVSIFMNQLIKDTACIYRPWTREPALTPSPAALGEATGYSFPSSHTTIFGSILGGFAWAWRKRWPAFLAVAAVLVALVAFSRCYLGVHAPQDVLFAIVEVILVICFVSYLLKWVENGEGRDVVLLVVGLALCALAVVYIVIKPYPTDYVDGVLLVDPNNMRLDTFKAIGVFAGVLAGWFCERRFVGFATDDMGALPGRKRIVRIVTGAVCVLFAYFGLGSLISLALPDIWANLLRFFLTLFTVSFVAPAAFVRAESALLKSNE